MGGKVRHKEVSHLPQSRCRGLELRVCGCCNKLRNAHVVDYSREASSPLLECCRLDFVDGTW